MRDNQAIKKVGESIKHQRTAKGFTQKYLAKKAQISERTLSRAEQGKTELRITSVINVCKILGVKMDDLF